MACRALVPCLHATHTVHCCHGDGTVPVVKGIPITTTTGDMLITTAMLVEGV